MRNLRHVVRGVRQYSIASLAPGPRRRTTGIAKWSGRRLYTAPVPAVQEQVSSVPGLYDGSSHLVERLVSDIRDTIEYEVGGKDTWIRILDTSLKDFASRDRKRIAIVGDRISSPRMLTDAILQDPISDPPSTRHALLSRYNDGADGVLRIIYQETSARTSDQLGIPSTWLRSSGCDLLEITSSTKDGSLDTALVADAFVLIFDPFRLGSPDLLSQLEPLVQTGRPFVIVVDGKLPGSLTDQHATQIIRGKLASIVDKDSAVPDIRFTDTTLALKALDSLHDGLRRQDASPSTRSKAFELFQHAYIKSRIGSLQNTLSSLIPDQYRNLTALSTARLALRAARNTASLDRTTLNDARQTVTKLREEAVRMERHAYGLSVISRTLDGGLVEGGVDAEIGRARQAIEAQFQGRYAWISLLVRLRIDDVGAELAAFIDRSFCMGLEKQIIYETGQLAQLQLQVDREADDTIRQLSTIATISEQHPLASPLLRNRLSALSLAIPSFGTDTLLGSIRRRRRQLIDVCVNRLQSDARRTMMMTTSLSMAGVAASWWLYVPPAAALSAMTATGLGILSIISALYMGQRRWARAQRNFWSQWTRSTEMLGGDLQHDLANAVKTRVVTKAIATADGLDRLIEKRGERLSVLEGKVALLDQRLQSLASAL